MNLGFIPVSLYDVQGLEDWLNQKGQVGLRPTHLGSFCSFQPDGAQGARYRLVAKGKNTPAVSLAGWDYALPLGLLYWVYTTTDPALPTPPQDFSGIATRIRKAQKWYWLFPLFFLLLLFVPFLFPSKWDVQPDPWRTVGRMVLAFSSWEFVGFILVAVWMRWGSWHQTKQFLIDQQRRLAGLPVSAWPPSPSYKRNTILELVLIPLLLIATVSSRMDLKTPLEEFHRPYIPLSQIETVPLQSGEAYYGTPLPHFFEPDYGQVHHSILATTYYEVFQEGYDLTGASNTDGITYTSDLKMTRMNLVLPSLSQWVAETVMDGYRPVNLRWTYSDLTHPDLDFVIHATVKDRSCQMIALGTDRSVAVFYYNGTVDLSQCVDLLATLVTQSFFEGSIR